MSREDKIKAIENIQATMKIENQELTPNELKLLEEYVEDKYTLQEMIQIIKNMVSKKV